MREVLRQGTEERRKSSTNKHQVGKEMVLQCPVLKDVLSLIPTADTDCGNCTEFKAFLCSILHSSTELAGQAPQKPLLYSAICRQPKA